MSALDKARKFLEVGMQQEMCRMMSSEFVNVNKLEVTPFMAVMRMIKLECGENRPELYKMLVTVLHDYNPLGGPQNRHMTIKYINILLDGHPELADYLVSILPPVSVASSSQHALHTMAGNTPQQAEYGLNKRALELVVDTGTILPVISKKLRKQEPVKFYNFTTPAVNAYVASQGVPTKITSGPRPSPPPILPIASYMPGATNVLLPPIAESGKLTKVNVPPQIQVAPVISSVVALATEVCAATASVQSSLSKTFKPQSQNALGVAMGSPHEIDRNQKLVSEQCRLVMITDSFWKDCQTTDLSVVGINKVQMMNSLCTSLGSVTASVASPKAGLNSKCVDVKGNSRKLVKKEPGCPATPANINVPTLAKPVLPLPPATKVSNGEPKSTAKTVTKQSKALVAGVTESGRGKVTRNLASFPYGQQMLFSNGKKQSIVVNSPHQLSWPTPTPIPDAQTVDEVPSHLAESRPIRQLPVFAAGPQPQQEAASLVTVTLPARTPLQCLQQMVDNTGKDRDMGYVDRIRDKLMNSINDIDDTDTDVSSTTEPVTSVTKVVTTSPESAGHVTVAASRSDIGPAERSGGPLADGLPLCGAGGQTSVSRSELLDTNSEEEVIVMSQYDGTSDCDSSVDPDTQSERSSPKLSPLDLPTDGGFEPHGYLARLTDMPSPPNYTDPWGRQQGKAKEKKRPSKKKRRK